MNIFVFCINKQTNQLWDQKYKKPFYIKFYSNFFKIRAIILQINDLLNEIELDRKIDESITIFSDKDQILIILLQMNYSLIDRRQFINIYFKEYQENLSEIENIEEF